MDRLMQVSVKSRLGGQRVRMRVIISLDEEEIKSENLNNIMLSKTLEKIKEEYNGSTPVSFLKNLEMISIKDI